MSKRADIALNPITAGRVLKAIDPGAELIKIETPAGSFSNYTHILHAVTGQGAEFSLVVRRYKVFGDYDRSEKARREYKTYELLQKHGLPSPEPLILDTSGELLKIPGIVMKCCAGEQVYEPRDSTTWARHLAETLVKIHSIPVDPGLVDFLLDADAEASWFARLDEEPDYMKKHPEGSRVWRMFLEAFPSRMPSIPALVHMDYWAGNILWQKDRITCVLDWEEAALGDPAIDVAYSLLDTAMLGYAHARQVFLETYQHTTGSLVQNLPLWELAAAVRPMFGWGDEIYQSPARERLQNYISSAAERLK